jgi:peptidyl-prolyl cis-trans isomerase SurA
MMGAVLFRLLFCLLLLAIPAAAQETRIAAVVNDEIISVADLEQRLRVSIVSAGLEDTPETRQRIAPQVLRGLIDEKLQLQEAERLNVRVTDEELAQAFRGIEAQNNLPPGGLEGYLAQRGLPKEAVEEQIRATIAWGKLVRRRYAQTATVSEEEITEAMTRLEETAGQPLSRVAEIFLAVDDPRQEEEVARAAERLFEQLRGGAPFPAIAQQFSQSATAAVGGDIGWILPSQLAPELAQTVERLRPGELSLPVRGPGGFYLLLVVDRRIPGQPPPAPVSTEGSVELVQILFPLPLEAAAEQREATERSAQAVSLQAQSCADMRRLGRERAPQTSGDLGRIRIADLPPDLREVVARLEVGQASPPLPLRGGIGVLMVCERDVPPPPAPVAAPVPPNREEIAENLARQKLEIMARRYLRDLRRLAFVDVRV